MYLANRKESIRCIFGRVGEACLVRHIRKVNINFQADNRGAEWNAGIFFRCFCKILDRTPVLKTLHIALHYEKVLVVSLCYSYESVGSLQCTEGSIVTVVDVACVQGYDSGALWRHHTLRQRVFCKNKGRSENIGMDAVGVLPLCEGDCIVIRKVVELPERF